MKKLLLILALVFIGCSTDKSEEPKPQDKCYTIISRGFDERGNFIIINYSNFEQKRYQVGNYQDYLSQSTICEPINLTQQSL